MKFGKSDNKLSDVSLGLQRLHYNSCLINRFFISVLCSNILKRLLQRLYKFSPHLNFVKVHDRMSKLLLKKSYISSVRVASADTRAALPDPPM